MLNDYVFWVNEFRDFVQFFISKGYDIVILGESSPVKQFEKNVQKDWKSKQDVASEFSGIASVQESIKQQLELQ